MPRFGLGMVCGKRAWCSWNVLILVESLLCIASVSIILGRVALRRIKRRPPGFKTHIGRMLVKLVRVD
jgi:hypothetical protein